MDTRVNMHTSFAGFIGWSDSSIWGQVAEILDYNDGNGDGLKLGSERGAPENRAIKD